MSTESVTNGRRTYTLQLVNDDNGEIKYQKILARSITAAIALLYELYPEYSGKYRVTRVEEIFFTS